MPDLVVGLQETEIWTKRPDFVDLPSGMILDQEVIKGSSPLSSPESRTFTTYWTANYIWQCHTHAEKYEMYQFWLSRMGRVRSFFLPTWTKDFSPTVAVNNGDDFITVEMNNFNIVYDNLSDFSSAYSDPSNPPINRFCLVIIDKQDNLWFRQIKYPDGIVANDPAVGQMKIFFAQEGGKDESLPDLALDDISLICLVPRVRCQSNNMPFNAKTDSVYQVQLSVKEVPFEVPLPV